MVNKGNMKLTSGIHPLRNNPNITITPRATPGAVRPGIRPILNRAPGARMQTTANMRPWVRPGKSFNNLHIVVFVPFKF